MRKVKQMSSKKGIDSVNNNLSNSITIIQESEKHNEVEERSKFQKNISNKRGSILKKFVTSEQANNIRKNSLNEFKFESMLVDSKDIDADYDHSLDEINETEMNFDLKNSTSETQLNNLMIDQQRKHSNRKKLERKRSASMNLKLKNDFLDLKITNRNNDPDSKLQVSHQLDLAENEIKDDFVKPAIENNLKDTTHNEVNNSFNTITTKSKAVKTYSNSQSKTKTNKTRTKFETLKNKIEINKKNEIKETSQIVLLTSTMSSFERTFNLYTDPYLVLAPFSLFSFAFLIMSSLSNWFALDLIEEQLETSFSFK